MAKSLVLLNMSIKDVFKWTAQADKNSLEWHQRNCFLRVATAIGRGSLEEKLLRIMVWTGAALRHGPVHSGMVNPLEILQDGTGWCDQQVKVFGLFCWYILGIDTHEVSLAHSDGHNGHTVAEAFYNNTWHLYDVHCDHQAVYRDSSDGHILCYEELEKNPHTLLAEQHWWTSPNNGIGKAGFYSGLRKPHFYKKFSEIEQNYIPWLYVEETKTEAGAKVETEAEAEVVTGAKAEAVTEIGIKAETGTSNE